MPARVEQLGAMLAGVLFGFAAHGAEVPETGFLEFLGMLVEDDGVYLDPLDMAGDDWSGGQAGERAADSGNDGRTATPAAEEEGDHETRG